jgi:hypothetical protein
VAPNWTSVGPQPGPRVASARRGRARQSRAGSPDGGDDRPAEAGAYDFEWLTSPHRYGFSMGSSDGTPMDEAGMRRAISNFLAQINHETGYLD